MRGNSVALAGNIYPRTRDEDHIELRFSASGVAFSNFNLSCWSHKDDDESVYTTYRCTAFGDLAENIAESLEKGDSVIAFGRIQANIWDDKDGDTHYDQQVIIEELGPSLRWGTATPVRVEKKSGGKGKGPRSRPSADDEAPF